MWVNPFQQYCIAILLENKKPKGSVMFSGGIAMQHWTEMG